MERDRAWGGYGRKPGETEGRTPRAQRDASPGGAREERGGAERSGGKVRKPGRAGQHGARYPEGRGEGGGGAGGPDRRAQPTPAPAPPGYPPTVREPMQPMARGLRGRTLADAGRARGECREPRRRPSLSAAPRLSPLGSAPPAPLHPSPLQPPSPPPPPPPGSPAPALLAAAEGVARGLAAPGASLSPRPAAALPEHLAALPGGPGCRRA